MSDDDETHFVATGVDHVAFARGSEVCELDGLRKDRDAITPSDPVQPLVPRLVLGDLRLAHGCGISRVS